MDLIKGLLENTDIIGKLTGQVGLEREEAERFVPAATEATVAQVKSGAIDPGALLGGGAGAIGELLSGIDVGQLASRVGIGKEQAGSALAAFVPVLMGFLQSQGGGAGGLGALLGGAGAGGLLGKVKGLGKLLGGN